MESNAIIMMILILVIVVGGFICTLHLAYRKEKEKLKKYKEL